jgi:uncharacterized protein YwqG
MQNLPSFLSEFKSEIEKYRLEAVIINATPLTGGEVTDIQESKFLGKPYLPIGFEYPKSKDGNPMILLAQINFRDIPPIEHYPTSGILQLYVSPFDWYDMEDYRIVYHQNIESNYQIDFSFLMDSLYEESPIYCEHKLSFRKEIEYGGREDVRFDLIFNGLDYFEYQETLKKPQQDELDDFFYKIGHKIGGYAYFTQSDPRDYDKTKRNDVLLLQIDTDEQIMFGDSGVANVFIDFEDLKRKNFDKAYFNWDCC